MPYQALSRESQEVPTIVAVRYLVNFVTGLSGIRPDMLKPTFYELSDSRVEDEWGLPSVRTTRWFMIAR
jgi:hypothetical protein